MASAHGDQGARGATTATLSALTKAELAALELAWRHACAKRR